MRFSLQDIPKTVRRRGDDLALTLHFLRPGEIEGEIAQLIAFYEQHTGLPQRLFSSDDARALVGDYRIANCLLATLSNWYRWQTRTWDEALQEYDSTGRVYQLLSTAEIHSPTHLRLALYTVINQQYHGFLSTQARMEALAHFANTYQLEPAMLEYLLALDTDSEALLIRASTQAPTPHEISTLYNQWAFEAALFSASQVQFVIDYTAFAHLSLADPTQIMSTGIGSVIKRLCYLARKLGVYYDLEYKEAENHLLLTLYGPQEVTGRAQQYGMRLARLCRLLLGYALAIQSGRTPSRNASTLSTAIVSAQATVHMLQRTYAFAITPTMLNLLHITPTAPILSPSPSHTAEDTTTDQPASLLFDSSIEQHFAEAFSALASNHNLHGWHLEREPEPLLLPHSIFIPDFALTRAKQRIYVEILGFWTPAYRERKLQKLQYLRERGDILLALPHEAAGVFAPLAPYFPLVLYDEQLAITDLLQVLQQRYDDFAERLGALDSATIQAQVEREGLLSEQRCYAVLHCYRRAEIQRAAERITNEEIIFTPGIGLYQRQWLQEMYQQLAEWLRQETQRTGTAMLPQAVVIEHMRAMQPVLATCDESVLHALLTTWTAIHIEQPSIFETYITLQAGEDEPPLTAQAEQHQSSAQAEQAHTVTPRVVRERRAPGKKRNSPPIEQEALWDIS